MIVVPSIESMIPPRDDLEDKLESSNAVQKLRFSTPLVDDQLVVAALIEGNRQIQNVLEHTYISPIIKEGRKVVQIVVVDEKSECDKRKNALLGLSLEVIHVSKICSNSFIACRITLKIRGFISTMGTLYSSLPIRKINPKYFRMDHIYIIVNISF